MLSFVRVLFALVLFAVIVPAAAFAQDPIDDAVPPSPLDIPQGAPLIQDAPAPVPPASPWDYYLHDPYYGTPDRYFGTATTTYYPWPGKPYYGPRYYGFRPSWFGAGYPNTDFAGFGW